MSDTLKHILHRELREELNDPAITDICINRPGEFFIDRGGGWERVSKPGITFAWCTQVADVTGSSNERDSNREKTFLTGILPDGERISLVRPPSCESGTIAIAIRKHRELDFEHKELCDQGLYEMVTREPEDKLADFEHELLRLKKAGDFENFFPFAVEKRRSILIGGPTGFGKTVLQRAFAKMFSTHERILTIQDSLELKLLHQLNRVHLLCDKEGGADASEQYRQAFEFALRMVPTRIIVSELRGAEAWMYVVTLGSGHPGPITTCHGDTVEGVVKNVARYMGQDERADKDPEARRRIIYENIDIILVYAPIYGPKGEKLRRITQLYYNPYKKRGLPDPKE